MEKIRIFKLVDGTFIIGKLDTDECIVDGLEIMMVPGRTGGMGFALVPFMYPFNKDQDVPISKSKYIAFVDADAELTSKYIEVKTGIVTPAKSIIH